MQAVVSSPEVFQEHAQGLLLGFALGESEGRSPLSADLRLPVVAQALVVAELLASGGAPEAGALLGGWARQELGARPGSISSEAVLLFERGLPPDQVAEAAARVVPNRAGDAPLTSCLPVALACHGSGAELKAWARRCASATHAHPSSQLAAVATALLARDLITLSLPDCLARVSQALRSEAPLEVLSALGLPDPGEGVPEGDDAVSLLRAAVHCLAEGGSWEQSVATAVSRRAPGDRLPALVGALAGARWGAGALPAQGRDRLPEGLEPHLLGLALELTLSGSPPVAGRSGG